MRGVGGGRGNEQSWEAAVGAGWGRGCCLKSGALDGEKPEQLSWINENVNLACIVEKQPSPFRLDCSPGFGAMTTRSSCARQIIPAQTLPVAAMSSRRRSRATRSLLRGLVDADID